MNPWLKGYELRIRWEDMPGQGRRCIGEGVDRSTGAVIWTETVVVPNEVAGDFRAYHGVAPDPIAEETIRGRLEDHLERIARHGRG